MLFKTSEEMLGFQDVKCWRPKPKASLSGYGHLPWKEFGVVQGFERFQVVRGVRLRA